MIFDFRRLSSVCCVCVSFGAPGLDVMSFSPSFAGVPSFLENSGIEFVDVEGMDCLPGQRVS